MGEGGTETERERKKKKHRCDRDTDDRDTPVASGNLGTLPLTNTCTWILQCVGRALTTDKYWPQLFLLILERAS